MKQHLDENACSVQDGRIGEKTKFATKGRAVKTKMHKDTELI